MCFGGGEGRRPQGHLLLARALEEVHRLEAAGLDMAVQGRAGQQTDGLKVAGKLKQHYSRAQRCAGMRWK
eukprot:366378-Chlamydomonas_euryale.AAC.6